jgi:hypothetical protein
MNLRSAFGYTLGLAAGLLPAIAMAQSVSVTRSVLLDQPYTLIYPEEMVASGGVDEPVTVNHPNAPLQCSLTIVPAEDAAWSAEDALAALDDAEVTAAWAEAFPGFTLGTKAVTAYQSGPALFYDATTTDSPMGVPLTIVHTEAVDSGRGYVLDCLFATAEAGGARPIVDFIIANFSTRSDAECCIGATAEPTATDPAAPQQ